MHVCYEWCRHCFFFSLLYTVLSSSRTRKVSMFTSLTLSTNKGLACLEASVSESLAFGGKEGAKCGSAHLHSQSQGCSSWSYSRTPGSDHAWSPKQRTMNIMFLFVFFFRIGHKANYSKRLSTLHSPLTQLSFDKGRFTSQYRPSRLTIVQLNALLLCVYACGCACTPELL